MIRTTIFSILLLTIALNLYADDSTELTGVIIGTEKCLDYDDQSETTTENTTTNLFDNDFDTYFASYQRSGGWAGLDLGEKHIITSVAYCPREDRDSCLLLGVFEGANNPDFGDAIPLFIISEKPLYNEMTEIKIDCSRAFRYVRYVGPNDARSNIAELKFYGYKGAGDDSGLPVITNLPAVVIHTVDAEDIVIKDKYIKGIVSVISENGTKIYTDSLEVRGRGNMSWGFPKKPYRMKLYNKASLLGLPAKEKNWTLINNYGDKTLMRNLLAFDLSERYEMEYTPAGTPVNVFLNGEYKGCYQLCDHIQVAPERVEVEEMKNNNSQLPELSGGYLIEIDAYADQEISWFISNITHTPVTVKSPGDDEITMVQYNYIKDHFNKLVGAVFSPDFTDPLKGYRRYMDTESFIKHFLIGEISGNTDTYWSVYMYKKRNNDIFYTGPVWDFDLAYENDIRTYPINDLPDWIYNTRGNGAEGMKSFVNKLFTDSTFSAEVKEIYSKYRDSGAISEDSLLKVVDDYESEIDQSQALNFMRWNIMDSLIHQNALIHGSYYAEVDNVRSYIAGRIKKVDEMLGYEPVSNENIIEDNIKVWSNDGRIFVNGLTGNPAIYVYDLNGRTIFAGEIESSFGKSFSKGLYIIRIVDKNIVLKSSKILVY